MLRTIRIILAALFFLGTTLLLLDFTGVLHLYLGWMAKIQFVPAILALNFGVVAVLVVLTLLLGRVYCSVICPLGILQDIISHFNRKKNRFKYTKAHNWLRYSLLVVFIVLLVLGLSSIASLIAPYSSFGRIATNLLAPVYGGVNNLLAMVAEHYDSYAFYKTDVYIKSLPTFIVATVTFVVIFVLAFKGGRTWCNNICPVGTVLGFLSRFSLLKPVIDAEKCVKCGLCGKNCRANCINTTEGEIDYSRCVVCLDCIKNCNSGAIKYTARCRKTKVAASCPASACTSADGSADKGRREALSIIGLAAATAALNAQEQHGDGSLAVLQDKQIPQRGVSPKPAGSGSVKHFSDVCTACQLCVSKCPEKVLRPSTGLDSFMQPEMSFEAGYCRPECTRCSEVCPTGAISKLSRVEKSSVQIGHAVVIPANCVVRTDDVDCGNCARHCPAGAIRMVKEAGVNHKVPAVNAERCIGCGSCEYHCPARPVSAIYVEGHLVHRTL